MNGWTTSWFFVWGEVTDQTIDQIRSLVIMRVRNSVWRKTVGANSWQTVGMTVEQELEGINDGQ